MNKIIKIKIRIFNCRNMSLRRDYNLSTASPSTPIRNTSTPFPNRRKSILSPKPCSIFSRRYSLSDVDCITPVQKSSRFLSPKSGTNLPVNLRKSPENKELLLNHQQMKYNKPGVFPIVHLNKKELPILKEKSKNVTIRLASPDICRQNSSEHNRLLLEKVVRNSPKRSLLATTTTTAATPTTNVTTMTNRNIEISTRSVLDALKEISRKRIHTNEELEYSDDGKRIRLDRINDNDLLLNKKRQRGDSPPYDNCQNSNKQSIKRQCSLNEVLASQSSMEIKSPLPQSSSSSSLSVSSNETTKQKNKNNLVVADVEIHAPSKKPCLVNAETQTQISQQKANLKEVGVQSKETIPPLISLSSSSLVEADNNENIGKSTVETSSSTTTTTTVKSSACLKVFDEAPLERTRKDRLSVLMGIKRKSTDIKANLEEKPIMSILSNSINKHLKSSTPKHVTFNLESESTNETNQEQQQPQTIETTVNPVVGNNLSITQTTASITTPLISSVVSEITKSPDKNVIQINNEPKTISKETTVSFNQTKTTENTIIPTFSFTASKSENPTSHPVTSTSTIPANNLFGIQDKTGNLPTTTTSTPPKIGGFKFDLTSKATSSTSFTLPRTTVTTQSVIKENPKPAFFFAGSSNNNNTGLNQTNTTTTSSNLTNATPQFSLSSAAPKFNFTSSVTTTTTPTTTSTSLSVTSFRNTGGFNLNFTPQTTQSFVNPNPVATTTTAAAAATGLTNNFGIQSTQSSVFGNLNPIVTATTTATTMSGTSSFGIPSTTSNIFGSNSASTFGSTGFNFVGGGNSGNESFSNTNTQIAKPTFGNLPTTQQNLFTTTTLTTAPATITTTRIFNTNVFNTAANTTNVATSQNNPPAFGAVINNPTNIFGSNAFNTSLLPSQSTTTTTQPQQNPATFGNVFDTNKPPPAFGENSTGFNTTTFGSTTFATTNQNQPIFGSNTNNNNNNGGSFSTNPPPTSPANGVFTFGGNPNKTGAVFSFGQNEPPKPTFNFATNTGNTGFNNSFTATTTTNVNNNNNAVVGTPQFNPPVAGAMFNIGSGGASSTPRARTQLKAKRRT